MVDVIQNGCKIERFYRHDCPHGAEEHIVGSTCVLNFSRLLDLHATLTADYQVVATMSNYGYRLHSNAKESFYVDLLSPPQVVRGNVVTRVCLSVCQENNSVIGTFS